MNLISREQWNEESKWESKWWGNCVNTLREELLQFAYAKRMKLQTTYDGRSEYNIDMKGASVLDIGGGPCSLLLKCVNVKKGVIIDPCLYPKWVTERYRAANLVYLPMLGEDLGNLRDFDEIWIYNVLQHTINPKLIVDNIRKAGHTVRVFEWINTGVAPGHPHDLTEQGLNEWFQGKGTVEPFKEHGAEGICYYGVFER